MTGDRRQETGEQKRKKAGNKREKGQSGTYTYELFNVHSIHRRHKQ